MFKVDDVIIVFSTTTTGLKSRSDCSFCKVIAVGKYDLFCEHIEKLTYSKLFRVSKERCFKVPDVSLTHNQGTVSLPKLGDLVMSVTEKYGKDRKVMTGVVEEIVFDPVNYESVTLKIRTGSAVESVNCNSVIILESNS